MSKSIKEQSLSGITWNAIGQFSANAVKFALGIIIARLLTPADYGVVGMLSIFLAVSQSFVDSGFGNALIRKNDRTEVDNSTVFYFNVVIACLFYTILYVAAPYIAAFYNMPVLTDVARVLSLTIVISSLGIVPRALRSIAVDFKSLAIASVISALISGGFGLYWAYNGYGVWALVWQSIVHSCVNVAIIWLLSRWKPLWAYSWDSFKTMFAYGSKLMASGLLNTIYSHASTLIIGKFFSPAELGKYSKGQNLASIPSLQLSGVFHAVTFPILARLQDDDEHLIHVYHKYLAITSLAIFFFMTLLAVVAKPLVLLLLTEKWIGAVPFLQIFCLAYMFDTVCKLNNNMLYVKGWSGLFLKLEIIKKVIITPVFLLAIPHGVMAVCFVAVAHTVVDITCSTYCLHKYLGVGVRHYVCLLRYFFLSILACAPAYAICNLGLSPWVSLPAGGAVALALYWLFLHKDEQMNECLNILLRYFHLKR